MGTNSESIRNHQLTIVYFTEQGNRWRERERREGNERERVREREQEGEKGRNGGRGRGRDGKGGREKKDGRKKEEEKMKKGGTTIYEILHILYFFRSSLSQCL